MSQSNRVLLSSYLLGQQSASAYGRNYVRNSMAVNNTENVSITGTATVARNTTTPLTNIADFAITLPNNATDYVEFTLDPLDLALAGQNCQLLLDYRASSIGSNVQAQVVQGGVVASNVQLSVLSNASQVSINTVCGTATTTVRISNATGNTGTSAINVANVTYGKATNIGSVAQAQFIGSAFIPATTNCEWSRTGTSLGAFSTDTDCPGPTIEFNAGPGSIQTTDSDLPQFTVNNLPAGQYEVKIQAYIETSVSSAAAIAINDGTSTSGNVSWAPTTTTGSTATVIGNFNYNSAGNRTFALWGSASSGSVNVRNDGAANPNGRVSFSITRFPTIGEIAVRSNVLPGSWTGYHDSTCSWTNTGGSVLQDFAADATCNLVEQINQNFGTVASALSGGNKLPGITFTPQSTGRYMVLAGITSRSSSTGGNNVFGLTADGGATYTDTQTYRPASAGFGIAMKLGGIVNITSLSPVTIKVQALTTAGTITMESETTAQTAVVTWSIVNLDQAMPAPILVGSVTSQSTNAERLERLTFGGDASASTGCTSTPCTIAKQSGNWVTSVTRSGTGTYTVNVAAGIFSDVPSCTCGNLQISNGACYTQSGATTTSIPILVNNFSVGTDAAINLLCMGPR